MKHSRCGLVALLVLTLSACGADDEPAADTDDSSAREVVAGGAGSGSDANPSDADAIGTRDSEDDPMSATDSAADTETESGSDAEPQTGAAFGADADVVEWQTDAFGVEGGQERYLCFAKTLEEDMVVNAYNSRGDRFVHHLIFSRARSPETEGFSECDVSFKSGWEPLFITGAGDTTLEFPDDAGHVLTKGTQLVVQMHLLNVDEAPVNGSLTITMRRSSVQNPRPVSTHIFGTAAVELPPHATTEVVGTCSSFREVKLIAGFPHMHMLGAEMHFEVGASEDTLEEVFARAPFDFDDQRIDAMDLTIAPGQVTRVRCTFDNTLDQTVSYGESTLDEMCYFIGFAVDQPSQGACLEVIPPFTFGR